MSNFAITSRFELNLNDPSVPLPFAASLAAKHRMAAIVLYDPSLIIPLNQLRLSSNAKYKIILAVDFPYGANYVLEKFKQLPPDFVIDTVDGFDILLSSKTYNRSTPNEIEVRNEVKILRDFVHRFNKQLEVRYVIDAMTRDHTLVENALKAIKLNPATFIRLEHNLEMPATKANLESTTKVVDWVRQYTAIPVKISTNVDLALINGLSQSTNRFDVSVQTAQKIIHELENPAPASAPASASAETKPAITVTEVTPK